MSQKLDLKSAEKQYKFLSHSWWTEVRLIGENKRPIVFFVKSFEELIRYYRQYRNECYNIYLGIHERRTNKYPGKAEDIVSVKSIVIDVDAVHPKDYPASDEELKEAETVADKIISDAVSKGFQKPAKMLSGNGYQVYYPISPIRLDGFNRYGVERKIKEFNRIISRKYSNDRVRIDNIGDLPRIIRAAGTVNVKGRETSERPHRLAMVCDDFVRREDRKLRNYLERIRIEKRATGSAKPKPLKMSGKFKKLLKEDAKLRDLYRGNWSGFGYKSRSEAELALICKLKYYSFSESEIVSILASCGIGKWQTATESYRNSTLRKACEFVGG